MKQQPYDDKFNIYNPSYPSHLNSVNPTNHINSDNPTNHTNSVNPRNYTCINSANLINLILNQSSRNSLNYQAVNPNIPIRSRTQYHSTNFGPIQQVSAYPAMNQTSNNNSSFLLNIHQTMANVSSGAQPILVKIFNLI